MSFFASATTTSDSATGTLGGGTRKKKASKSRVTLGPPPASARHALEQRWLASISSKPANSRQHAATIFSQQGQNGALSDSELAPRHLATPARANTGAQSVKSTRSTRSFASISSAFKRLLSGSKASHGAHGNEDEVPALPTTHDARPQQRTVDRDVHAHAMALLERAHRRGLLPDSAYRLARREVLARDAAALSSLGIPRIAAESYDEVYGADDELDDPDAPLATLPVASRNYASSVLSPSAIGSSGASSRTGQGNKSQLSRANTSFYSSTSYATSARNQGSHAAERQAHERASMLPSSHDPMLLLSAPSLARTHSTHTSNSMRSHARETRRRTMHDARTDVAALSGALDALLAEQTLVVDRLLPKSSEGAAARRGVEEAYEERKRWIEGLLAAAQNRAKVAR